MQLNDAKEQFLGTLQADRAAWKALGGKAVGVPRDLGVSHGGRRTHPPLAATTAAQQSVAARLATLGGHTHRKGAVAVAMCCGEAIYGCKTQRVTRRRQMRALRNLIAASMNNGCVSTLLCRAICRR